MNSELGSGEKFSLYFDPLFFSSDVSVVADRGERGCEAIESDFPCEKSALLLFKMLVL